MQATPSEKVGHEIETASVASQECDQAANSGAPRDAIVNPYQSPNASPPISSTIAVLKPARDYGAASRWRRLFAALADGLILTAAMVPFVIAHHSEIRSASMAGVLGGVERGTQPYSPSYLQWSVYWLVHAVQWILIANTGQSIGKMLFGTRIVRIEDDRVAGPLRAVVLRVWLRMAIYTIAPRTIGLAFMFIDLCWIFLLPSRCLHDIFSGTRVINVRASGGS